MWRYLAAALGAVLLLAAGYALLTGRTAAQPLLPAAPAAAAQAGDGALPVDAPEASAKTREEKRFGRYDKDKDGRITREEYLANRRKAYARLDTNHDGALSFDEWSIKATDKFASADANQDGAMIPAEFLTTAVKRKSPSKAKCACPTAASASAPEDEG